MNILLVDDQRVLLDSLNFLLEKQYPQAQVYKAVRGADAIPLLETTQFQVALLDVNMPGMNGIELAHLISDKYPAVKIIMLTDLEAKPMILDLAKIVQGFLFKNVGGAEVIAAVEAVMSGQRYFCKNSNDLLLNSWRITEEIADVRFDKREIQILELMANGCSMKEISEATGLKEGIVLKYKEDMIKKTKTKNMRELISFAFRNALIFSKTPTLF